MIELLTVICIIAVLASFGVMFVAGYINDAKKFSDQRTLTVLNDALNRYKCEGGDLSALTQGAPIKNVLAKLASTINWNGLRHFVMQRGTTYPARSLSATGEGKTYQFTKYNSYAADVDPEIDILSRLSAQGTPADAAMKDWVKGALASTGTSNFLVLKNPTDRIELDLKGSGNLYVNWGDGSTEVVTLSSSYAYKNKIYSSTAARAVVLIGNVTAILSNYSDGRTAFGGDISTMSSLTSLGYIGGTNTLYGDISKLTSLTRIDVGGSNMMSGSISGLINLNTLSNTGPNTLSGDIGNLNYLTYICLTGSNSVTGSISKFNSITTLYIGGANTITGDITNKTSLVILCLSGSNTVSGSISSLTNLTFCYLSGNNTVSGKPDNLNQLQAFTEAGNSNVDHSTVNWNNLPSLSYVNVKNLTQSQVDSLLAGMWYNKDAPKPNSGWFNVSRYIRCNSGCAAPTDQIVANQLKSYMSPNNTGPMVWTVLTN